MKLYLYVHVCEDFLSLPFFVFLFILIFIFFVVIFFYVYLNTFLPYLPCLPCSQRLTSRKYIFSICEFIFISNQYNSQPYMIGYTVYLPILVPPSQIISNPGLDVKLGRLFLSPYCHYHCPSTSQGGPVCVIVFVYYASVFVCVCLCLPYLPKLMKVSFADLVIMTKLKRKMREVF